LKKIKKKDEIHHRYREMTSKNDGEKLDVFCLKKGKGGDGSHPRGD